MPAFSFETPVTGLLVALVALALRGGTARELLAAQRDAGHRLKRELRAELARSANASAARQERTQSLDTFGQSLAQQVQALSQSSDRRLAELRQAVEQRPAALRADNGHRLGQLRATVDEKLHATLGQRLGEIIRLVAERLEQVHRGLGEMQLLARDVGALDRVLIHVKTRGLFGEVQLSALLEQVLAPEQYATNVETVPGSGARVELAVRLPGRRDDGAPLWLPIDCKFPREDSERLVEARLRTEARASRDKYVAPPPSIDFAFLFVPTEGLYAEALQREHRVVLAGPTTLLATLNSLQMGFRTLALEKRSAEVRVVLGAVKTEFRRFGEVLARTKKKLDEAGSSIELAERRTRTAVLLAGVEPAGSGA